MQHTGLVRSESWHVVLRLNNAEGVLGKGDDCGFFEFLSVCLSVHEKPCIHVKRQFEPSVRLLKAFICLPSWLDFTPHTPPVKVKDEKRKKEELWEGGRLVLSL